MLEGGIVLDLSRILAGPYATQLPADLADVIKVDSPRGDDTRDWGRHGFVVTVGGFGVPAAGVPTAGRSGGGSGHGVAGRIQVRGPCGARTDRA